jgi:hypothetical protein
MSGSWKEAHVGPDFGDDGLDRYPTGPWYFVESSTTSRKGASAAGMLV